VLGRSATEKNVKYNDRWPLLYFEIWNLDGVNSVTRVDHIAIDE